MNIIIVIISINLLKSKDRVIIYKFQKKKKNDRLGEFIHYFLCIIKTQ